MLLMFVVVNVVFSRTLNKGQSSRPSEVAFFRPLSDLSWTQFFIHTLVFLEKYLIF